MQKIKNVINQVRSLAVREEGQGMVEYILVTGVIAVVIVTASATGIKGSVATAVTELGTKITDAI